MTQQQREAWIAALHDTLTRIMADITQLECTLAIRKAERDGLTGLLAWLKKWEGESK